MLQKVALTSCFIAVIVAHGGIYTYEIDGKKYDGYDWFFTLIQIYKHLKNRTDRSLETLL